MNSVGDHFRVFSKYLWGVYNIHIKLYQDSVSKYFLYFLFKLVVTQTQNEWQFLKSVMNFAKFAQAYLEIHRKLTTQKIWVILQRHYF